MEERTGFRVLYLLWSYVKEEVLKWFMYCHYNKCEQAKWVPQTLHHVSRA